MHILWLIHTLRFASLFVSLIAFICHVSQCILLNVYQQKTGIPDWLTAGHWQYLLWYISLGLSLAGSLTLCLSACYFNRPKKYPLDKWIGSLSILSVIVSIITAMTSDTLEPWTNGLLKIERSLLVSSCSLFDASRDKFYPLLYQRCILSDSTWIFSILLCIIWTSLVGFVIFASFLQNKKKNAISPAAVEVNPTKPKEPNWGRYIPDKPPAASIYSVTTRRSSIGLLTPTSVKYGSQYYFEDYSSIVPSIPSTKDNYYGLPKEKGGHYYYDDSYYGGSDYKSTPNHSQYYNGRSKGGERDYYRFPSLASSYYYNDSPTTPSSYYSPTTSTTEYSSYDYQEKQHLVRSPNSPPPPSCSPVAAEKEDTIALTTPLYMKFASKSRKDNNFSLR